MGRESKGFVYLAPLSEEDSYWHHFHDLKKLAIEVHFLRDHFLKCYFCFSEVI